MKKALWLTSWYPSRVDAFDGDFIQRHAGAVAGYCEVQVIHVIKDKDRSRAPGKEERVEGNLKELVIYYQSPNTGIKLLDQLLSQRKYKKTYRNAITDHINANGKPDLVHVHVAMKAGLAALWIKKKWNIPFIVTEHWTAYLQEADIRIADLSFIFRKYLQRILTEASAVTIVSDHLGKAMQNYFPGIQYQVVPNVVDTGIFFPAEKTGGDKIRLIHASNMNYQKNTEDILRALKIVKEEHPNIIMVLYGPVRAAIVDMVSESGLQGNVSLKGEVPQTELANAMRQADALLLYSRFETFGCVLPEANACGIPVIVSDLEVFHELLTENVNGVFVKGNDPAALAKKIIEFISEKNKFNKTQIATAAASRYNFAEIGKQFLALYDQLPVNV